MEQNRDKKSGSLTVEVALALPIFFFSMMLCIFMTQLLICQDEVQWALTRMAREASVEVATLESDAVKSKFYLAGKMGLYMKGSKFAVSMSESEIEGEEIDLVAKYSVKLPFEILFLKKVNFIQRIRTRAFVGVESRAGESGEDQIVYITETGRVYHLDKACTYLKLSISQALLSDIEQFRNEGGGKYKPCKSCIKKKSLLPGTKIYITNYGDRYHLNRTCSRIKRTIFESKLSEVGKRPACSKCGGG